MTDMTVGSRLASARKRRGLTQTELADESGLSLSFIRKVEQGEILTVHHETLRRLAAALRVTTLTLAAPREQDDALADVVDKWEPVRRALVSSSCDDPSQLTVEGTRAAFQSISGLMTDNKVDAVLPLLPGLIRDANALGEAGRNLRTHILIVTGRLLVHTHQYDTAELTLTHALDQAGSPFYISGVIANLSWVAIRRGDFVSAYDMCMKWAHILEPKMSTATYTELAAWGDCLSGAAMAAARNNQPGAARDALRLAHAAAVISERDDAAPDLLLNRYEFGTSTVRMRQAELAMVEEQPDIVLKIARSIPAQRNTTTAMNRTWTWHRHRLDVAMAHVRTGQYNDAMDVLHESYHAIPEWFTEQHYARDIMRNMIEQRRTLTPEMRSIADAIHLEY